MRPNKHQSQFIQAAMSGKYSLSIFEGQELSGKTMTLAQLAFLASTPHAKGLVIVPNKRTLDQFAGELKSEMRSKIIISRDFARFDNGAELHFKTASELNLQGRDIDVLRGFSYNWAIIDEIQELEKSQLDKVRSRLGYPQGDRTMNQGVHGYTGKSFLACSYTRKDINYPPYLDLWLRDILYRKPKSGSLKQTIFHIKAQIHTHPKYL